MDLQAVAVGGVRTDASNVMQQLQLSRSVRPLSISIVRIVHQKHYDAQEHQRQRQTSRPSGTWSAEEERILSDAYHELGSRWSEIAKRLPGRNGKQCRARWNNHLDPSVKKDAWSGEEERILTNAQIELGNRWVDWTPAPALSVALTVRAAAVYRAVP